MLKIKNLLNLDAHHNLFIIFCLLLWIMALPFKNSIYQLAIALINISFLFIIIKNKDFSTLKSLLMRDKTLLSAILVLLSSMTVSNIFGLNPQDAFIAQLKFFYKYILVFFALLYLYDKKYFSLKILATIVLISLSIQALNGLFQHITSTDIFSSRALQSGGLTGSFSSRNVFGLFMLISSALFFMQIQMKSAPRKLMLLMLFLFSISVIGLLFSYSRASWLAFAVFYFIILFSAKKGTILLTLIIPPTIVSLFLLTNDSLVLRLEQLLVGNDSNRIEIWLWTFNSFKENWLLGYGLESWSLLKDVPPYRFVHNSILDVALHLGIIGLFSYVFLSFHIIKKAFQCQGLGLFALGVALFVISLFDHSVLDGKLFLPILTLYAAYVIMASQQNEYQQ